MDAVGVALASVITSGVLGITTSSIAIWTARQNAKLARENRTYQRLADSYLEVLRLAEREAQWLEARTNDWNIFATNHDHQLDLQRPELPERALTDRTTMAAHIAAYGSTKVRDLHEEWQSAITAIGREHDSWDQNWSINVEPPSTDQFKHVLDVLLPIERAARRVLKDSIAEELGRHRPTSVRWWNRIRSTPVDIS